MHQSPCSRSRSVARRRRVWSAGGDPSCRNSKCALSSTRSAIDLPPPCCRRRDHTDVGHGRGLDPDLRRDARVQMRRGRAEARFPRQVLLAALGVHSSSSTRLLTTCSPAAKAPPTGFVLSNLCERPAPGTNRAAADGYERLRSAQGSRRDVDLRAHFPSQAHPRIFGHRPVPAPDEDHRMPEVAPVLIDGAWIPARARATREVRNPATLDLLGLVARLRTRRRCRRGRGGRPSPARMVAGARRREGGLSARVSRARSASNERALSTLMARETRQAADRGGRLHRVGSGLLRLLRRGGPAELRHLDSAGRGAPDQLHDQGAVRRRRGDRAVQLPAAPHGVEGGAGARGREHAGLQAPAPEPALEPADGAVLRRPARRRGERDHRRAGRPARRSSGIRAWTSSPSPARWPRGAGSRRRRARSSRRSISSSAAWTRSSSSRMPTSTSPSPAPRGRGSSTRARCVPRPSGCTWSSRSRASSPSGSRQYVRTLRVGDPMDPAVDVGPLISAEALDTVERQIAEAVSAGRAAARRRLPRPAGRAAWAFPRSRRS